MKGVTMKAIGRALPLAVLLALAGCASEGVLAPVGPIGAGERTILLNSLVIMLAIVIPTIIATLGFAWWFRAGNSKARYLPEWAYSGRVELVVWSIPILVILFLAGVIWVGSHDLDPFKPIQSKTKPVEVQVVSLDWKWLFIYPEQGVASVNQLVVPAGVPVHFSLTSGSVMNMFFVHRVGSMIMTMNGMVTQVNLQADKPGTYWGQSAQFSGDGFSDMHFQMRAVPAADFAGWVAQTKGKGPALDAAAYAGLTKQSVVATPYNYGAVQPGLFDQISHQKIAPGAGPQVGRAGPEVSPRTPR
jgi:cytochrome o ubiquinol oxidase subunit 2